MWVLYTLLGMIFYGIGEYYAKYYANGKLNLYLPFLAYIACTAFWFPALKSNNQLAVMTIIWDLGYLLIGVFIGAIVFKEVLNVYQWVGVGLAIISLLLLTH